MTDREKVIKGLECCCVKPVPECEACPYADEVDGTCFTMGKMLSDAIALLKAQEPKQARIEGNDMIHVAYCPTCGKVLKPWGARYCYDCGQAVKWDD